MTNARKVLIGAGALVALGLGGGAIAIAGGDDDDRDVQVTGTAAQRAGAAATAATGGGRVVEVERTDEAAPAYYEVKVDKGGDDVREVQVSRDFAVTSQKPDDDGSGRDDD